ncbi:response regulator [Scleromatobacter humisilvae]|uniref:Response regulator n=1 Tax=Scleromatobacter humisilvae TaxID=2897159 RepID=A0A9X1YGR2_9BURK|nr:response regulator [Scleromatobacter humisilvae]MCK9685125.1 response regulator [Scleromatobacter humisilvae]
MTTLFLALIVAFAAGFAAWRVVVRRRSADTQAARETATRTALAAARQGVAEGRAPVAAPPANANAAADVEAARATARAKAERVIAAEAARRKAAIQKAQNVARVEAERRAAEAAKAAAELASTLPANRLPRVERTTPILPRPAAAAPAPALVEKTTPLVRPAAVAPRKPVPTVLKTVEQTLVMLVDDSKMVRVKSSRLLASHGFQVVTAVDGIDALKQLENCCPDLVITDVDMPGMDGFGLVSALRGNARTQQIPLVMITSAEDRHRDEAMRLGVGLVMGKPYDEAALIAHIRGFKFFARADEPEALACA